MSILKYYRLLLVCLMAIGSADTINSQDIHTSSFAQFPSLLNPAQSGNSGVVRANISSGIQKYNFAQSNQTYNVAVDAKVVRGLRKSDWIGVGISMKSGGFTTNLESHIHLKKYNANIAYHIGLDSKKQNVLTFGFQYGLTSFKYGNDAKTESKAITNSAPFNLFRFSPRKNYRSFQFGTSYKSWLNKLLKLELGIGVSRIQIQDSDITWAWRYIDVTRLSIYGNCRVAATRRWTFEPSFYSSFGDYSEGHLRFLSEYLTSSNSNLSVIMGLGYGFDNYAQVIGGIKHHGYTTYISYSIPSNKRNYWTPSTLQLTLAKTFNTKDKISTKAE